jgi:hypothetical protein
MNFRLAHAQSGTSRATGRVAPAFSFAFDEMMTIIVTIVAIGAIVTI